MINKTLNVTFTQLECDLVEPKFSLTHTILMEQKSYVFRCKEVNQNHMRNIVIISVTSG